MLVVFGLVHMRGRRVLMDEIILRIEDDYCQGEWVDYVFQAPPEELKAKKLKAIKVTRENK